MTYLQAAFVTGTDTDCGKTRVSCALLSAIHAQGYSALGMKPVASGSELIDGVLVNDDAAKLKAHSSVSLPLSTVNPYTYRTACSPHFAADMEGPPIDIDKIQSAFATCRSKAEVVIVEGVGGWRVPIANDIQTVDMVRSLGLPVILVVGLRLGCINHALLSAEAIRDDGIELRGWIANCVDPEYAFVEQTLKTLNEAIPAPFLGRLDWQADWSNGKIVPSTELLISFFWPKII